MSTPVIIGIAVLGLLAFAFVVFLIVGGICWAMLRKKKAAEPALVSAPVVAFTAPRTPDEIERDEMAALALKQFHDKWTEQKQAKRVEGFQSVMAGGAAAE